MRTIKSFLILCVITVIAYGIYSWLLSRRIHKMSDRSTKIAQNRFFEATLNDTISRVEEIYQDSCRYEFWINNYSMHRIIVNVCKYPILRQVDIGTKIVKDSNSNECIFIKSNSDKVSLRLDIEY
jgi:hypothetical protein